MRSLVNILFLHLLISLHRPAAMHMLDGGTQDLRIDTDPPDPETSLISDPCKTNRLQTHSRS